MGLATENPRWGYLRIVGRCAKLGVSVSATSVGNALSRHRLRPAPRAGPSWPEVLRAHAAGTLAWDFFHVESVMLARLCVLFFIDLERRLVYLAELTAHPVGPWATQQARDLVAYLDDRGCTVGYLVRGEDAKFVGPFTGWCARSVPGS